MKNMFTHCEECGTRSFSGDKLCGICKDNLSQRENTKLVESKQRINFTYPLVAIAVALVIYFVFIEKGQEKSPLDNKLISDSKVSEALPEAQLTIINNQSNVSQQIIQDLFKKHLITLIKKYPDKSERDIANALVSGYNIIRQVGSQDTLLEFTTGFDAFLQKINGKFKIKIEDALGMFIKTVYSDR